MNERGETVERNGGTFNGGDRYKFSAMKVPRQYPLTLNWLMLFREIIVVYSDNHTKPMNTPSG
jgi:hypothetical protein